MMVFFYVAIMVIFLFFFVLSIGWLLGARSYKSWGKSSSFECGFDAFNEHRLPFSFRFFLLSVVFLVFDVEVVLLYPFVSLGVGEVDMGTSLCFYIFLFILFVGLLHEWSEGSLDWMV
uniref:NADH-ubiquinone oxidoreductase chain 3 n=1 Tax=Paralepetopsis sp. TaxID=3071116 RepID=A0AA96HRM7_9GAST|nr:NADH dehydrogenase subunit 3 [Paralepetopsis sp.]